MIEALRPSTLGEILDRTAEMYRARFLVFLGIAAVPAGVVLASAVAVFLFLAWIGMETRTGDQVMVGILVVVFFAAGALILVPLCAAAAGLGAGALNHAAAAAFQHRKLGIRDAYRAAWKHGWRYIWLFLLEALIIFVAPAVAFTVPLTILSVSAALVGPSAGQAGNAGAVIVLFLLLALAAYVLWMLLMLCLSYPASVAEDASAWKAVKRAIALSRGTRGRILVLYILGLVLRWGLGFLLTIPAMLVIVLVPGLNTPQHSRLIGTILLLVVYGGSFALRAFTKPVYAIAQLLFYYDQRIRREGFDIEWMMSQAGLVEVPLAVPEAAPWISAVYPKQIAVPMPSQPAQAAVHADLPEIQSPVSAAAEAIEPPPPAGEPA